MKKYDFLIIGGGVSGMRFALKVARTQKYRIALCCKTTLEETNTSRAQGGIASVTNMLVDDFEKHIHDTMVAGDWLSNPAAVEQVVRQAPKQIEELVNWGVNFDRKDDGSFDLHREGGHSEFRILHHADDTGAEIQRGLMAAVRANPYIDVLENHFAVEIITQHHLGVRVTRRTPDIECYGAYILNPETGKIDTYLSRITLMATGGTGAVYATTTNPDVATGDGIAMVYRAKGLVKDMEFVQFHPTALTYRIQTADRGLRIQIHLDTAAHIVRTRGDRDILLGNINADTKALGVDIWEMVLGLLGVFVGDIETDMVKTVDLHLVVNSACHDIAWRKRETWIVFLHKLLAIRQAENTSVTTHRLGDEVSRMRFYRVIQGSWVKLHKLHVFDHTLSAIDHRNTVARSHIRVSSSGINSACAACSHKGNAAEVGVDLARLGIEDIGSIALNVGCAASDTHAEVVLGDDLNGKVIFKHIDIGVVAYRSHESTLDLCAGIVSVVEDTELGVSTFTVEVESAVGLLIKVNAPVDEFLDLLRRLAHDLLNRSRIAEPVARYHGVVDMLLEVIYEHVGYTGNTALCTAGVGFFKGRLAAQCNAILLGASDFERKTHARYTATDDEKIILFHCCI